MEVCQTRCIGCLDPGRGRIQAPNFAQNQRAIGTYEDGLLKCGALFVKIRGMKRQEGCAFLKVPFANCPPFSLWVALRVATGHDQSTTWTNAKACTLHIVSRYVYH